jgi:hypothetical protein
LEHKNIQEIHIKSEWNTIVERICMCEHVQAGKELSLFQKLKGNQYGDVVRALDRVRKMNGSQICHS